MQLPVSIDVSFVMDGECRICQFDRLMASEECSQLQLTS